MTYPQTFKPEQKKLIDPIVTKLQGLQPGGSMSVSNVGKALATVRYLIYAWLHNYGIAEKYRIRTKPNELIIECKHIPTDMKIKINLNLNEFVVSNLLDIKEPDRAKAIIKAQLEPDEREQAFEIWKNLVS